MRIVLPRSEGLNRFCFFDMLRSHPCVFGVTFFQLREKRLK